MTIRSTILISYTEHAHLSYAIDIERLGTSAEPAWIVLLQFRLKDYHWTRNNSSSISLAIAKNGRACHVKHLSGRSVLLGRNAPQRRVPPRHHSLEGLRILEACGLGCRVEAVPVLGLRGFRVEAFEVLRLVGLRVEVFGVLG